KYRSTGEDSWYFFTSRDRKYRQGKRPDRRAGDGFYRASATIKPVYNKNGKKIGSKRSLVYHKGDHKNSVKTNWLMMEYVIEEHQIHINNQTNSMKLDDCVVYKIYYNHKKSKNSQLLEQGESSQCQGKGGGGGGNEAAGGCTEMVVFVEQAKVDTEMGKSTVDKGKGILLEDDDSTVDQYLNLDHYPAQFMSVDPSCPSSSMGSFDNNNAYVSNTLGHQNMPISSNGQFNNNFNFEWQNGGDFNNQSTQVYGFPYFDGSENVGYDDEQIANMQFHDQLNSLISNNNFNFQFANEDSNQFDSSPASQSNGNDIASYAGYIEQLTNMQFNGSLISNDASCNNFNSLISNYASCNNNNFQFANEDTN
ncbi:Nac domain-containing protein, partial [Thalictrum thalictroides]